MLKDNKIIDMTQDDPLRVITVFALPMIFSNLFQQLYNVADSMIIGTYLGMDPFAAIGSTGMITAVLVQLSTGLSLGGSIVTAQFYGSGQRSRIRSCASTLSLFMIVTAAVLTLILMIFCEPLLRLIRTPNEILPFAVTYLRIYILGCIPIFLYNALSGVYSALGNSRTPLRFLIISSVLNILLDFLFIAVLGMNVEGAAAATVISQFIAMGMVIHDFPILIHHLEENAPSENAGKPPLYDRTLLRLMLRFALPAALQQSIVSVGNVIVQTTVNSFGTTVVAACVGASRILNLTNAVPINFGNAFGNYVGQNIGANKIRRIYDGLKASLLRCGIISLVMALFLELFPKQFMQLFINGPQAVDAVIVGARYIRVAGAFLPLLSCYMLTKAVFKGSGDMSWFLFVTLLSFVIRLILTVGFARSVGMHIIWWSIGIGWSIAFAVSVARLLQGGWKTKKVVSEK